MFGQFLLELEDGVPDDDGAPVGAFELVDPVLPPAVLVLLPDAVPVEPDPVLELAVGELVAALAINAPPVTSPLVKAPTASALRTRSFMVCPL
jgi:hypothetical protein